MPIISNIRSRKSDPTLEWVMFHKIAHIYRDIREQESEKAREIFINFRSNLNSNNTSLSSPIRPNISIQQPKITLDTKTVPKDLKDIQPHTSQVWDCDDIGFTLNGSCFRVVCTCMFFTRKCIWKYQPGEISHLLCTALIFTRADA